MNLSDELGANAGISTQCLTLSIPDHDRDGNPLTNQRQWVLDGANLLARMGGGVTIMPAVEGGWVNSSGVIIWEKPVLIYTFIKPSAFRELLPELRKFLHSVGRETRHGEVAFEFDGRFYRITKFDASGK